jgi:hypothetical protein
LPNILHVHSFQVQNWPLQRSTSLSGILSARWRDQHGPVDDIKASWRSLIFSSIVGPTSWHKSKIKQIVFEAFTFYRPISNI